MDLGANQGLDGNQYGVPILPHLAMKHDPETTAFARSLRKHSPDAENALWLRLKSRRLCGVKFRRQQAIGHYIVDFASLERHLVIELDGGQHDAAGNRLSDELRTRQLAREGYTVLRFWDNEVLSDTDGVLEAIAEVLASSSPSP